MDDSIAILGRQPVLGLAELESLYGRENIISISDRVAQLKIMPCSIDFSRLGGTIKLGKILKTLETDEWEDVIKFLVTVAPNFTEKMPTGKMHLGLSVYGLEVTPKDILSSGLRIKKAIHNKYGRTVHLI